MQLYVKIGARQRVNAQEAPHTCWCCRQVLVLVEVLKSLRLSGHSRWRGAEVTVGEKLLIWCFEPVTYQLPQAGALLSFSKSGTKYQYQNALIAFPGKAAEGKLDIQLHKSCVIFIKTSYKITYIACMGRFFDIFRDEHMLK